MAIITRFAPSPTGNLHIGGVRTALFNYLFSRKNKGQYLLRIDDTDKVRSKKEYEENILNGFKDLGLIWDNKEIIRQSERTEIYRKYIEKLLGEDKAYVSKETEIAEGERAEVIRLRNPNKPVMFTDMIRGEVTFDTTELGDFVIAKSADEPVYHFASVIDDFEMGITHVIRAEEHLSNTSRQILIQEAVGAPRPIYAHIPMILAPDRSKLSKRHGATALTDYIMKGYLPEAIINYLAFLGWNPGGEREIYSLDELVEIFDIEKVQKAGAIFNIEKLDWYNHQYIMKMEEEAFISASRQFIPDWLYKNTTVLKRLVPIIKEKVSVLEEIASLFDTSGELCFVKQIHDYPSRLLLWKNDPVASNALLHLERTRSLMREIPETDFDATSVKNAIWKYADEHGKGNVLWPLRVALTGQERSPDPFVSAHVLGKYEALKRIDLAYDKLSKLNDAKS